jgi:hypothetical protein
MNIDILLMITFLLGTIIFIGILIAFSYLCRYKALKNNDKYQATYIEWAFELYVPMPCYVNFRTNLMFWSLFVIIACAIGIYKEGDFLYVIHIILQIIYTIIGFYIAKNISKKHRDTFKHLN